MKKGHDIKKMVEKINNDVQYKKDYIVDLHSISIKPHANVNEMFPNLWAFSSKGHQLTDHSLGQLCGRLDIGRSYISKCLPVSQELVAHNLNFWINKNKNRKLMIRTKGYGTNDTARAIMSDRYKRIDNDVVVNHSLNKLMDMNAELKYAHYDGDYLNITAVTPKLEGEVEKDDIVQGGITITNSEVGGGSLIIQPFIYRLVCTNGMVAPRYLNRFYARHVGKIVIDTEKDDQWITIIDNMKKQIELVSNSELFQENLQKLKDATKQSINSHQIVQLAKRQGVSDSERAQIFERLGKYVGDTFTTSKYELANAITNLANDEDKTDDRARFLQELGGLIIFANNPMAIRV